MSQFRYLGMAVTSRNLIQEDIKMRLNSGNACYHSVQNLLPSRRLSKYVKSSLFNTIILPVFLNGCETWSLTLREEHRLRMFENRVLWKMFGPKRDEVMGEWRKLHNDELHNVIRIIKSRRMRWAGHVARMRIRVLCIVYS
jgi:hypothetical protein